MPRAASKGSARPEADDPARVLRVLAATVKCAAPHLREWTGKNLRQVKLRTVGEATSPTLHALIAAAAELDAREPKRVRAK
jgi:hypothetical protein